MIPMSKGNMEDIEQDGNVTESMNSESMATSESDSSMQVNSQTIYEREDRFVHCYLIAFFCILFPYIICL